MLNPNAPMPLYRQLAELLTDKIRTGEYPVGSRIPSEPQLAAVHGIGRPTIRQALDQLVRKGLLTRRRGSGTFVCQPQQEVDLFSLDGTAASFRKKGLAVLSTILMPMALVHVSGIDNNAFTHNPFAGQRAYRFSRLTRVDGDPVLIEEIFLHAELFAGIDRIDMHGRSLSAVAEERFHLQPSSGKQSFHIGYVQDDKALHLQVKPEMPILVVNRQLHFAHAACGVFSQMWCRTDRFVFSQSMGGSGYA